MTIRTGSGTNHFVARGMEVLGADARTIGIVREVGDQDIIVARPDTWDIRVPWHALDAMRDVADGQIMLTVTEDEIDGTGWLPADEDEVTGAMRHRPSLREGLEVVGTDEEHIGYVKDVRDDDMLVERSLRRDVYVPYDAITRVTQFRAVLAVTANEASAMDWPSPPLVDLDALRALNPIQQSE